MLLTLPDQAIITDILDSKTKARVDEPLSPLLNLKRKETLAKDVPKPLTVGKTSARRSNLNISRRISALIPQIK